VLLWRRITERIPPGDDGLDWLAMAARVDRDEIDLARSVRNAIVHREPVSPASVQFAVKALVRLNGRLEATASEFAGPPLSRPRRGRGRVLGRMRRMAGRILGAVALVAYLIVAGAVMFGGIMLWAVPFALMLSGGWLVLEALVNLVVELLGFHGPGYENRIILFEGGGGRPVVYALQRGGVGLATLLVGGLLANLRRLPRTSASLARRLLRRARAPRASAR
jgi:hypothetical protein